MYILVKPIYFGNIVQAKNHNKLNVECPIDYVKVCFVMLYYKGGKESLFLWNEHGNVSERIWGVLYYYVFSDDYAFIIC